MKALGLLLVIGGLAIALFVGYLFFVEDNSIVSPIPQDDKVKVIFVTPTTDPGQR